MTHNDFENIKNDLALLQKIGKDYEIRLSELKEYDGVILKRSDRYGGKYTYYYGKSPASNKFKYLGTDLKNEVNNVKETIFVKEALRRIEYNIELLEKMLTGYLPIDYESINNALSITYKDARIQNKMKNSETVKLWKEKMLEIKNSYPIKKPEQLKQRYVDGTMMRSKSEINVALALDSYGIPYVYEVPVKIDGYVIYPDFRLLSPVDFTSNYYLEHFGRLDLEDYQESVGWKISKYMKIGYMPNVNFFMTFDDIDGNADLRPLKDIILRISGKENSIEQL